MTRHYPVRARVAYSATLRRTHRMLESHPIVNPERAAFAASLITGIEQEPVPVDPITGRWLVELTEAQENRLHVDGFLLLDHLYFDLTVELPATVTRPVSNST